jgi:putative transcriptional regulator
MRPRPGVLLVASPQLDDPNFSRSVVFLVDHNKTGSLGFIINRALDMPLKDLWANVPHGLSDLCIAAEGGPVDRHKGLLLHGDTSIIGAQIMAEGVAVGGDLLALTDRWQSGADDMGPRLFLGHSGWQPGQLDAEIEQGSWIVRPGRLHLLFGTQPADSLWRQLIEGGGSGMPEPSLN